MMITGRPCKLKTGGWGVRITGDRVRVADTIRVNARNGKTWTATVSGIEMETHESMIVSTTQTAARRFGDTYNEGGDGYNPQWN